MASASVYSYTSEQVEAIQMYDLLRTALLFHRYYGQQAKNLSKFITRLQLVAAIGSSASLAGLSTARAPALWQAILGVAAIASICLAAFNFPSKLARAEQACLGFGWLHDATRSLVEDVVRSQAFKPEHRGVLRSLSERHSALSPLEEPHPDQPKLRELQAEIDRAYPPERFWLPG